MRRGLHEVDRLHCNNNKARNTSSSSMRFHNNNVHRLILLHLRSILVVIEDLTQPQSTIITNTGAVFKKTRT
jgi:hypothetical protein